MLANMRVGAITSRLTAAIVGNSASYSTQLGSASVHQQPGGAHTSAKARPTGRRGPRGRGSLFRSAMEVQARSQELIAVAGVPLAVCWSSGRHPPR